MNLIGRVVNVDTGAEIGQATVWAESRGQRKMAVTDAEGRFYFFCLDPGTYSVQVTKDGYQTGQEQADLLSGTNPDVVVRLRPATTTVRQPAGHTLSAREAGIPNDARRLYDNGTAELHDKKPELSMEDFKKAIEIYPDYDAAYVQLGITYARLKRPADAEQILRKAITVNPKNAQAHVILGKLLYEQGNKIDEAVEELLRGVQIDNNLWLGHLDLARIYRKQGKAKEAYEHAQRAHELNKEVQDVHLVYYNACVDMRDYAAALAELDEYVKLYPDSDVAKKMLLVREKLSKEVVAVKR